MGKKRIKSYAEDIRALPEYLRPRVLVGMRKLAYIPTNSWLKMAGNSVKSAMQNGAFQDLQNLLSVAFDRGGEHLWIELIKALRTRTDLPPTWDYLKTFAEDCMLVADAIDQEHKSDINEDIPYSPKQLAKNFNLPVNPLRKRLERLRKRDHNCFVENDNRAGNEPQFLYKYNSAVRDVIEKLKKSK